MDEIEELVVRHITGVRELCVLACVSRAWRRAATRRGGWECHTLSVDGNLARKLDDRRFRDLLLRAGGASLRRIEVHDAPLVFRFVAFREYPFCVPPSKMHAPTAFRNLEVLDVSGCQSVTGSNLLRFLIDELGVDRRPKHLRLDMLGLAGCKVTPAQLGKLDELVRHDRDPKNPFSAGPFDLWQCIHCRRLTDKGLNCVNCYSVSCEECSSSSAYSGEFLCKVEDKCTYWCRVGDCDNADRAEFQWVESACPVCDLEMCLAHVRICMGNELGTGDLPGCGKVSCFPCSLKDDVKNSVGNCEDWESCDTCDATWCSECNPENLNTPEKLNFWCVGKKNDGCWKSSDGCYKVRCAECEKKEGMGFVYCSGKGCGSGDKISGSFWCEDCAPESARSLPPDAKFVCELCVEEDEAATRRAARLSRLKKSLRIDHGPPVRMPSSRSRSRR